MKNNLQVRNAPHVTSGWTSQKIMRLVFFALLPAAISGIYHFGLSAVGIILTCLAASWITDVVLQKVTNSTHGWFNWSSLVTGMLFALVLPPTVPPWVAIIGSVFAISIGKYAFGKGNNIFNPALIARTFVAVSFPAFLAKWITPDGVTSATPLTLMKLEGYSAVTQQYGSTLYNVLLSGDIGGCIGETSAIAILLGAAILFIFGVIEWRIPTFYLVTVAVFSAMVGRDVIFDLLAGGLMLGAFFMATDYVTSPITYKGKIIFAMGCGLLTMLFRVYSNLPEGVSYAILLMNAAAPLIERYTKPRPFGWKPDKKVIKT
ncbi:RnfABCDGE type electron transport complex subunit D [Candidatus Woesearchaeota archaeon]|nr:RnfABCDGE type electron transport complex subunit D [Candidatus Woesearchaeota archaeon]